MEYRRFENTCFVRLDKGEEVLAGLLAVCRRENILLATVQGTGTIDDATLTVRYRRTLEKKAINYRGDMEIAACTGTVTQKEGDPWLHLHMVLANPVEKFCSGGHLERAMVGLNAEFVLTVCPGQVQRVYDPRTAIDRMQFDA